jgi:hypothetical protein
MVLGVMLDGWDEPACGGPEWGGFDKCIATPWRLDGEREKAQSSPHCFGPTGTDMCLFWYLPMSESFDYFSSLG